MSHIVDGVGQAGHWNSSEAVGENAIKGEMKGEQVRVILNPQSMIQEAAEEFTFFASEKAESKQHKKMQQAENGKKDSKALLDQLKNLISKIPDFKDTKQLEQIRTFLQTNPDLDAAQFLGLLEKRFGLKDPTHQFIALKYLEEAFEGQGDKTKLSFIKKALEALMNSKGMEVKSGLNISQIAAQYAASNPDLLRKLREFYRKRIRGEKSLAETYSDMLEEYGTKDFEKTSSFLMDALGADMSATTPSTNPSELKEIRDGLYQLEVFNTIHDNAEQLLETYEKRYQPEKGHTAEDLMKSILPLTKEKWLDIETVDQMKAHYGLPDIVQSEIYFMTGLINKIVKPMPEKIFPDLDSRNNFVDVLQESLDESVEKEEIEEESDGEL